MCSACRDREVSTRRAREGSLLYRLQRERAMASARRATAIRRGDRVLAAIEGEMIGRLIAFEAQVTE